MVILFCVNVPVLSEQITVVLPSVSTALSLLIMALHLTIFCMPIANTTVTTTVRPSGIAATASETESMKISKNAIPRNNPRRKITAQTARHTVPNTFPRLSNFF